MLEDSHRRADAGRIAAVLLLAALAGCTNYAAQPLDRAAPGRSAIVDPAGLARHLVLPGETLSELAAHYRVPLKRMIAVNRVRKPYHIYVGQVLIVPGPGMVALVEPPPAKPGTAMPVALAKAPPRPAADPPAASVRLVAVRTGTTATAQDEATVEALRRAAALTPPALSGDGFLWPVRGRILDGFGGKPNGARNDGINIAARAGTPVVAAEGGIVVYAAETIPGFGRMLLIRHADGFTTAYAHNRLLHVRVGDAVRRGQLVAEVGSTGNVATPQLHFELRQGKKAIDPSRYLIEEELRVASTSPGGG